MDLRAILVLVARILFLVVGPVLILQGVSTAGFVAIVGLFSTTVGSVLSTLALIAMGLGIVLLGLWMVCAGLLDFPLVRSGFRQPTRHA